MKKLLFPLFAALALCACESSEDAPANNVDVPADNKLTYTTDNNEPISIKSTAFDANITAHIYDNGTGTLIFDKPVTSIGWHAFYGCSSLTSINIPGSITSIEMCAFYGCSSLTSIDIPDSVTSIEMEAFEFCSNLTSINIPDSVTSIGNYAFAFCSSLTSITIPNSVASIGVGAFCRCSSLSTFYGRFASNDNRCLIMDGSLVAFAPANLTAYTIPDSVTSIGMEAFNGCPSLTSITIPDSVTSIGDYAFYLCINLSTFYGKFASNDNRCLIMDGSLVAFAPANLTAYTIPDSVTSIGKAAFKSCTNLTSITISDSVTSIGDYAFEFCSSLTSITIPDSVTSIERCAFYGCTNLTSITIPDSVASIGDLAFYGCTSLTSITLPNSVTSIGESAFGRCSSLSTFYGRFASNDNRCLIVDDSLVAFAPANLTAYTIPDSVTSIERCAFYGCTNLTSITIPDSVTSIGDTAFSLCSSLTSFYCKRQMPPTIGIDILHATHSSLKIYVPRASVDKYKTAWSDYASKIYGYDF